MSQKIKQQNHQPPEPPENKMGTQPVHRLLLTTALPIVVSMLVGALYNIVDSIFVARINENAFIALSLAFPFQNLIVAVGVGTGVGINALLSRSLGEKNFARANKAATNGLFLGFLSYLFFALLAIVGARPFMETQSSVPQVIEYGVTYIRICGIFSFGQIGQLLYEKLLQSTGKTNYMIAIQGLGAVINIILDPIMIFGYFGFPAMGVSGAAYATVIAQTVAMLVGVVINEKKNTEISVSFKGWKPELAVIKEIYRVGVPSIIVSSIGSVMVFAMNKILVSFSGTATAALGVYFKVQSFVFMPVFGVTNALVAIVAYNYGAQNKKRIEDTIKLGFFYSILIMAVGSGFIMLFPRQILGFFQPSDNLIAIGVPALRIISTHFVLAGYCIVASSIFQALRHGLYSATMSVTRQLGVLIPLAYVFSLSGNVQNIWWSFFFAEVFAVGLATFFLVRVRRKVIEPLPDVPPKLTRVMEEEIEEMAVDLEMA